MKFQAYIAVFGSEQVVHAIHKGTNVPGADIRQYEKVTAQVSPTGLDKPWGWKTARTTITGDLDHGLQDLLSGYKEIFPAVAKYREPTTYVSLVLIAQHEEGDQPRGVFLSHSTVALLDKLGAGFDYDVVQMMHGS